ncbi:salicylate hydroxylase [Microdochium nivale]|nr:salicylate hydroxylase [Microdochium nivale]
MAFNGKPSVGHFQSSNISYPSRSLDFLDDPALKPSINDRNHKLDILIVGAGLGGLAAAAALARQGHHTVRVLEQAKELGEVGAGIQVPPNSARLLSRWGVDRFWDGEVVEPGSITFRRWQCGKPVALTPLRPEFAERYGAPYLTVHRAHFHVALRQRAVELGVEIKTGAQVVRFDSETPSVTTREGQTFRADLVVVANGIKSTAHESLGRETTNSAYQTGFAAYRATVDVDKIRADKELAWVTENPNLNLWIGEDKHVMTYTISAGSSFNMVLSHVDWRDPQTWTPETVLQDMRRQFADWDPQLVKIINMIDNTTKWPLISMRPTNKWLSASGKLVMIGDAVHAMVPYMSQGAAMAIEDAAALAVAVQHATSTSPFSSTLAGALKVFERTRSLRSCQMQQASLVNVKLWHLPDGPLQQARDAATRPEVEGEPFSVSANQWSDPVTQEWTYGYDAEAEMVRALKEQSLWDTQLNKQQ